MVREISRRLEISLNPVSDFLSEEKLVCQNLSGSVYSLWRDWLYQAREDDRGYSRLVEPSTGTLSVINMWYETVKELTVKSATIIPSTKPEIGIISDMDDKIVNKLRYEVNLASQGKKLYPDNWANITNLMGGIMTYLFYRCGANEFRYELVVEDKRLRDVVSKHLVPQLDVFVQTWDGSFPRPGMIYRMAYMCVDALQPPEKQIFPNIKPLFEERKLFGPKKVRDMILTTPEEGVRKLVLEDDSVEAIRSRLFERTETKLCPAALFKTRVPKGKISEYLERMMRLYPELYGAVYS